MDMAMIDSSKIIDSPGRPRRARHHSGRNYDGEGGRTLELRDVLDVLSCYRDYEGGINCSTCGKLYKSKVCFIKHIWEHSVYWDQFAGDKNHERVLGIQAALILYAGYSEKDAERLMDLLVTSPTVHETVMSPGQKKTPNKRGLSVLKGAQNQRLPVTPVKEGNSETTEPVLCLSYKSASDKNVSDKDLSAGRLARPSSPVESLGMQRSHENKCPTTPKKEPNKLQLATPQFMSALSEHQTRYPTTPQKRPPTLQIPDAPRKRPRLQ